jgi:SSS family solute:Na+ symporter
MAVDTPVTLGLRASYPEGSFLWIVNNINFQYFSVLITLISAIVMVAVSFMTAAPTEGSLGGLTLSTASAADRAHTRASWDKRDVLASAFILCAIAGAYIYFRG